MAVRSLAGGLVAVLAAIKVVDVVVLAAAAAAARPVAALQL